MANPVVDYASLTLALSDFAHRADIKGALTDSIIPTDYFIQGALEAIQNDIPDLNFGNYIQMMEGAFPVMLIQGGVTPVPADWLGPKVLYISDGSNDQWPLIFKDPTWLNNTYPSRQASGLPAYVARDLMAPCAFTSSASITNNVVSVSSISSGIVQTGMILLGGSYTTSTPLPNNIVITGPVNAPTPGGSGTYSVANFNPVPPTISNGATTYAGGGEILTFGPYPDSPYQISGTYYQQIPALSASATTNWVTATAPMMLHAACMAEVGKFLLDDAIIARWNTVYQQRLKALVDRDKAERWSMATMQIEAS